MSVFKVLVNSLLTFLLFTKAPKLPPFSPLAFKYKQEFLRLSCRVEVCLSHEKQDLGFAVASDFFFFSFIIYINIDG